LPDDNKWRTLIQLLDNKFGAYAQFDVDEEFLAQMNSKTKNDKDASTVKTKPIDPLVDYLEFYKSLIEPSFAVLVTGEWGSGKTFQVKAALSESEYYYVSLFGLKSDTDVYGAVYNVMYPGKAKIKNAGKKADKQNVTAFGFGLPIGSIFSAIVDASIKDTVDSSRIIILDDLERCELPTVAILGIVNRYVEHLKCRVVVIAHDEKLPDEFKAAKEKIFGQTIKVIPKIHEAFDAFAGKLKKDDRQFIQEYRADLLAIFSESEVGSLRILRQIMDNAIRLKQHLSTEQQGNALACRGLIRLTAALDFEIKAGRLDRTDITNRKQQIENFLYAQAVRKMNKEEEADQPRIIVAGSRYPTIELDEESLSDDLLIQMLIDGHYDTELIRASISRSVYFLKPSDTPPWRTFIGFDQLSDDIVQSALTAIEAQLSEGSVSEIGELLHIFALRLMMSENKIITDNFQEVVTSCKQYIDGLVELKKLPTKSGIMDNFLHGYDGIGFWVTEQYQSEFNELFKYISSAVKRAWTQKFPELRVSLLQLVESDGEAFYKQVCHSADGTGDYVRVPILASISPKDFVDSWMRSHPKNWRFISRAIKDRSINARPESDLKDEAQWMREVVKLLEDREKTSNGIGALRIRRAMPQLIIPH
jgi:hypothetical protein